MDGSRPFEGENLLRELTPQVLAAVTRRFGDFSGAEDAVQEALLAAVVQWPKEGIPNHPRNWLIRVASRRLTDHLRAAVARRRREATVAMQVPADALVSPAADEEPTPHQDDTLILLFMCCHPALTRASAIALTLRAVAGLTTAEIASAFLVPETTMAQRISRAKRRIKESGVPFSLPTPEDRKARLDAVLHVLYLIFNEGYASSSGARLQRSDLVREAIRLTRTVHGLLPHEPEVTGLLALMLLTDARRRARTGPAGEIIPLADQDRTLWDRAAIQEGTALLQEALSRGSIGPYQLQAAIAVLHDQAARAEETDWPQILGLYQLLLRMTENPMVALNHAVAAAMVHGPEVGLRLLEGLEHDRRIAGHYRLDVVRAHLLEMRGDHEAAVVHYKAAAARTANLPERDYLNAQASRLSLASKGPSAPTSC